MSAAPTLDAPAQLRALLARAHALHLVARAASAVLVGLAAGLLGAAAALEAGAAAGTAVLAPAAVCALCSAASAWLARPRSARAFVRGLDRRLGRTGALLTAWERAQSGARALERELCLRESAALPARVWKRANAPSFALPASALLAAAACLALGAQREPGGAIPEMAARATGSAGARASFVGARSEQAAEAPGAAAAGASVQHAIAPAPGPGERARALESGREGPSAQTGSAAKAGTSTPASLEASGAAGTMTGSSPMQSAPTVSAPGDARPAATLWWPQRCDAVVARWLERRRAEAGAR